MTINSTQTEVNRMKIIPRDLILKMLQAALESGEYLFARQVAISWLAAFPGDLEIAVLQAQVVIAEGKPAQVIPVLDLVCRKDPFYLQAHRLLAWASREIDAAHHQSSKTTAFILGEQIPEHIGLEPWGKPLKEALRLIEAGQYPEAHSLVESVLETAGDLLLARLLQLLILRKTKEGPEIFPLALDFYARYPDCLFAGLILAESYLQQGNEFDAVRLLHLSASADSVGQAARRLWGEDHAYRSMWPEDMVIHFDHPVPAGVAGILGWNRLAAGEIQPVESAPAAVDEVGEEDLDQKVAAVPPVQVDPLLEVLERIANLEVKPLAADASAGEGTGAASPASSLLDPSLEGEAAAQPGSAGVEGASIADQPDPVPSAGKVNEEEAAAACKQVEGELEQLARKLRQPSLAKADGRFPVYVILTTRSGLEEQYGPQTRSVIDGELRRLSAAVAKRHGWQSIVFYPDDAACTNQYGLDPVNPQDPWKIKQSLSDLDSSLSKRGEMIGALMIVGGDPVVPFHRLPNPAEDSDDDVPSDSPYGTLDANYFVPEWPVGRLPGETGPDSGTLLEQIRQAQRFHARRAKSRLAIGKEWLLWMKARLEALAPNRTRQSFGYTAAVWRRSSLAVFRPIGAPHTVLASPPAFSGGLKRKVAANLGYYNLHGLEDSPAWYGQRDPMEAGTAPEYPVALSPEDLHRNGRSPKFVFSEACYGAHVFGKTEKDSLALKFISLGTMGIVASTCISYGSVSTPLIAADLLGHLFWQQLKSGKTAGEALTTAKVQLVREMNRRQGYLDGEDQKTLISFILLGDPLASYDGFRVRGKGIVRFKEHPMFPTISDENQEVLAPTKVPAEVLKEVKQIVAEYLPGADVAGIHFCRLQVGTNGKEQPAGDVPFLGRKNRKPQSDRLVVTVSKQVQVAQHLHRHYLHVTMDESGKTVKVALSH